MKLPKFLRKLLGQSTPPIRPPSPPPEPEPDEIAVPEVAPTALMAELSAHAAAETRAPYLLDIREPHEWQLVHMPEAAHIPMNDIPERHERATHRRGHCHNLCSRSAVVWRGGLFD